MTNEKKFIDDFTVLFFIEEKKSLTCSTPGCVLAVTSADVSRGSRGTGARPPRSCSNFWCPPRHLRPPHSPAPGGPNPHNCISNDNSISVLNFYTVSRHVTKTFTPEKSLLVVVLSIHFSYAFETFITPHVFTPIFYTFPGQVTKSS